MIFSRYLKLNKLKSLLKLSIKNHKYHYIKPYLLLKDKIKIKKKHTNNYTKDLIICKRFLSIKCMFPDLDFLNLKESKFE